MQQIEELLRVMVALRDPDTGCPWDREQDFKSIVPHTLEEAYEVAETIEQEDLEELKYELGDLLFQVVFYSQLGAERGIFTFSDVVSAITEKLVRRHPHVFADTVYANLHEQELAWEQIKRDEQAAKGRGRESALGGINLSLPALSRAVRIQKKAARVGFDWKAIQPVLEKVEEELGELKVEIGQEQGRDRIADELGDLLFSMGNLARHLQIDPEQALRGSNSKFERRFRQMETEISDAGKHLKDCSMEELDARWERAKAADRANGSKLP